MKKVTFSINDLLKSQSIDSIADGLFARRGMLMTQGKDPFNDDHTRARIEILAHAERIWNKRQSGDLSPDTIPFFDKSNKLFAI